MKTNGGKPNIILILIDDMGWRDLGCSGSTFYETPNIDSLCREGVSFTNAYAACPVCSPSRASLLTGLYPVRTGVTDWIDMTGSCHPIRDKVVDAPYEKHLPDDAVTLPELLHQSGYATWQVGKWHLGSREYYPERFGFEKNVGGCDWGHPHKGYFSPYGIETLPDGPDGEYLTDRLTDEAIKLIQSNEPRPFFLNLCHYTVHTPLQAKDADIAYFREKAKRLGLDSDHDGAVMLEEGEPIPGKNGVRVLRRRWQSNPVYAAMIKNLDDNIGRLAAALKDCGKDEDTVILFTSDNGGLATAEGSPTCNYPAREGKGWMYEGGNRVPMFVRWSGHIEPYGCCQVPMTTPDIMPTLLELAGSSELTPNDIDGVSLVPLLYGKAIDERPIFWHYPHYGNQGGHPSSAVLLGRYKYILFHEDMRGELYDLETDLGEQRDLAASCPETAASLRELLLCWLNGCNAKFPTPNNQ